MDETGQKPETTVQDGLKNDADTTTAPTVDNSSAEVERLRREAEQARMRANQLENELAKKAEADREAQRKQLEEKEEFRTLYDNERSEREKLQQEKEEAAAQTQRSAAQADIFKGYDPEVVDLAETAGLTLTGSSEADRDLFKSKLDKIAEKVKPATRVAGNNPAPQVKQDEAKGKLLEGMKVGFKPAAGEYISGLDAIKEMKRNAGLKVD